MKILVDEKYDDLAAVYQYRLIEILDEVLKRHNIPIKQRESICGDYSFDAGMLHDQGQIKIDRVEYEPQVVFRDDEKLYVRNELFEFHEYAFGNASAYFEGDDT